MCPRKKIKRLSLHKENGNMIVRMGEIEIWDGADLALLRETLNGLVHDQKCPKLFIDMTFVKYIPSGFFGLLLDCFDNGCKIILQTPQQNVSEMLWFRRFFQEVPGTENQFSLHSGPNEEIPTDAPLPWNADDVMIDPEEWNDASSESNYAQQG